MATIYGPITGDISTTPYGFSSIDGSFAPSTSAAKRGSYGFLDQGNGSSTSNGAINLSSVSTVYWGFWLNIDSTISLSAWSSVEIGVLVTNNYDYTRLYITNNSSSTGAPNCITLSGGQAAITTGSWHWVVIYASLTGSLLNETIYIDDVSMISPTASMTDSSFIQSVLGETNSSLLLPSGKYLYFDDIIIANSYPSAPSDGIPINYILC
jgi:hypothetical protein